MQAKLWLLTYKDLRCWIVYIQGLQDGCTIIRHHDILCATHALQYLVLQSRALHKAELQACAAGHQASMPRLEGRTIPLGPSVVLTRSAIAIAPTKEAWSKCIKT